MNYLFLIVILQFGFLLLVFRKNYLEKYKFWAISFFLINVLLITFVHYYLHAQGYNIEFGFMQSQIRPDEITYHNNGVFLKQLSFEDFISELKFAFSPRYGNVWPFFISVIYKLFDSNHMIPIFLKLFVYIISMYTFANILEYFNYNYFIKLFVFIIFSCNPIYLYVNTSFLRDDLVLGMLLLCFYFIIVKKNYLKFAIPFIFLILFRIPIALTFIIAMCVYLLYENKKFFIKFVPLVMLLFYLITSMIPRWGPMGINIFRNLLFGNIYEAQSSGGALASSNPLIVLLIGPIIGIIGGSPFYHSSHNISFLFSKILIYTNILLSPLYFTFIIHYIVNILKPFKNKKQYLFLIVLMFLTIYGYLFAYKGFMIRNFLMWGWILYLMAGYIMDIYTKSNIIFLYFCISFLGMTGGVFYYVFM